MCISVPTKPGLDCGPILLKEGFLQLLARWLLPPALPREAQGTPRKTEGGTGGICSGSAPSSLWVAELFSLPLRDMFQIPKY